MLEKNNTCIIMLKIRERERKRLVKGDGNSAEEIRFVGREGKGVGERDFFCRPLMAPLAPGAGVVVVVVVVVVVGSNFLFIHFYVQ